ncbi:MAG: phage tail sheath C-terminal domain-containing protein [Ginsengibacter sp.]
MSVLKLATPGVYVQEIPSLPPSVAEVETAIPAFVGHTEKAQQNAAGDLINTANKITSLADYVAFYGGPPKESNESVFIDVKDLGSNQYQISATVDESKKSSYNLYYSVRHFYDNGGGVCYIVSTGDYLTAISKDALLAGLDIVKDVDEVTLLIIPEAVKLDIPPVPLPDDWSPAGYKEIVNAMIKQASDSGDRFALIDPILATQKNATDPNGDIDGDSKLIRNASLSPSENSFAAAYYPNLITTYALTYDFANLVVDKMTPFGGSTDLTGKKMSELGKGSLLYNKIEAEMQKQYVVLPPSGAIAGLYTRVDATKGVWKAPANESLLSVVKPNVSISSREQEGMNIDANSGKSINAIRSFPGFGTLVWGARTLNGNDNEWKYISVRRFFNMVEESIRKSSHWAVFEPNTISTWVKMQAMIENYLFQKWRDGALAGSKPEQAFYVRVGLGSTMTSVDILEGRMNVEIGMAVSRPAEFIVLKFTQLMQQS